MAADGNYPGVMISSTFRDLKEHRVCVDKALRVERLLPVAMEHDTAHPTGDVIGSSLEMVRASRGYICVIGHRYGQIIECPRRNPNGLSVTELEFNEACAKKRPILLFLMGDSHPVPRSELDSPDRHPDKLSAFIARAKLTSDGQPRVYDSFDNLEEFSVKLGPALARLRRELEVSEPPAKKERAGRRRQTKAADPLPKPPAFYAEPPYAGSHAFVGRRAQLDTLSDWAAAANPHPALLFEAIGGAGKSMLTWEWVQRHAPETRADWAGRFWYSFYEKGAVMADFCRRALAYITGQSPDDFKKLKTPELAEQLLHHLRARPWLLVLDGLERVLVAYHRFNAAQLADDQVETAGDDVTSHRNPCAAIRPEDDDLLRALATAAPSKLLLTTRLTPKVLLNTAGQPIPGVVRERLPGLRPADAEALFRACGATGDSQRIQQYLQQHCDCHPLVTGVLAGLVCRYGPDRGNFDAWAADPEAGGALNLAELDLVQKRNHILQAALDALPAAERDLLSVLALLSEATDFKTLQALVAETFSSRRALENALLDLEQRGLLQYDPGAKRYDLHPVVRGMAAGGMAAEERERHGRRVVDFFDEQPHSPWEQAETWEDVRTGVQVVRTLLQMGHHQEACNAYWGDLANALRLNLEAHSESLALLRPFFPAGWSEPPCELSGRTASYLATCAAGCLVRLGEREAAQAAFSAALRIDLEAEVWPNARSGILNIAIDLNGANQPAASERCRRLALALALAAGDREGQFAASLDLFRSLSERSAATEAEAVWRLLDPMGRGWSRAVYRSGEAERYYAGFQFRQGRLAEPDLLRAEELTRATRDRLGIRDLHELRGEWHLQREEWRPAAARLAEAVRMAHEVGQANAWCETLLALARYRLGELPHAREIAEQLAAAPSVHSLALARLWAAIGDAEQVRRWADQAYRWAWLDGEPYVHRFYLDQARALLEQFGAPVPELPAYDPAADEKFPWEAEVEAVIARLEEEARGDDPLVEPWLPNLFSRGDAESAEWEVP